MKSHKDLDVWKKAIDLSADVYRLTSTFPKSEAYGITSQMRRAETQVEIASRIGLADKEEMQVLQGRVGVISKMLYGLIRSVEHKQHD